MSAQNRTTPNGSTCARRDPRRSQQGPGPPRGARGESGGSNLHRFRHQGRTASETDAVRARGRGSCGFSGWRAVQPKKALPHSCHGAPKMLRLDLGHLHQRSSAYPRSAVHRDNGPSGHQDTARKDSACSPRRDRVSHIATDALRNENYSNRITVSGRKLQRSRRRCTSHTHIDSGPLATCSESASEVFRRCSLRRLSPPARRPRVAVRSFLPRFCDLTRTWTHENSSYRRRPPSCAAVGGRRLARAQIAGDLAQALALPVLCLNVKHELVRDDGRPSRKRGLRAPSCGPASLLHEPLERVDGNEFRPPGHVQGLEKRQHPPTERRSTHSECLGGLRPRVSESLDLRGLSNPG